MACPLPHGQAPWSCRFVLMLSVLFRATFVVRAFLRADWRQIARSSSPIGATSNELIATRNSHCELFIVDVFVHAVLQRDRVARFPLAATTGLMSHGCGTARHRSGQDPPGLNPLEPRDIQQRSAFLSFSFSLFDFSQRRNAARNNESGRVGRDGRRGWDGRRVWDGRPPTPDGQGGTLSIYITRAKILYELKTRGLEKFSVSDLLQQPVMPMISIHIFARGKTPWTSQTRTLGRALI